MPQIFSQYSKIIVLLFVMRKKYHKKLRKLLFGLLVYLCIARRRNFPLKEKIRRLHRYLYESASIRTVKLNTTPTQICVML